MYKRQIVDSTTSTPYLLNPIQYGADVVVHSTSKYINGSGDAISGIIIDLSLIHISKILHIMKLFAVSVVFYFIWECFMKAWNGERVWTVSYTHLCQ